MLRIERVKELLNDPSISEKGVKIITFSTTCISEFND